MESSFPVFSGFCMSALVCLLSRRTCTGRALDNCLLIQQTCIQAPAVLGAGTVSTIRVGVGPCGGCVILWRPLFPSHPTISPPAHCGGWGGLCSRGFGGTIHIPVWVPLPPSMSIKGHRYTEVLLSFWPISTLLPHGQVRVLEAAGPLFGFTCPVTACHP